MKGKIDEINTTTWEPAIIYRVCPIGCHGGKDYDAAVKELVEAAKELSDLVRDIMTGDYKPDSFTLQPIEQAIKKVEGI
jgi:hypothetical protein